ncbi:MAG: putative transporter [FCB group bacterium]|jgi:putative transport protein|nr:putative transporter [FCB group bacterium]
MQWVLELFNSDSAAAAIVTLALVATVGIALGSIRIYGVSLGVAGVLFSGLLFGHIGLGLNEHVLEFAREFGLILFVYTIGLQVGPGFISSLRRDGLPLNLMAAGIVLLGTAVTIGIVFLGGVEVPAAVGLFSGATTNTPSLAAAQSALRDILGPEDPLTKLPGLGYAVAYPFGVIGIILTMLFARLVFRVDLAHEAEVFAAAQKRDRKELIRMNMEVQNANLSGMALKDIPLLEGSGVVISRVMHEDEVQVAQPDTVLQKGDVLLAVGTESALKKLCVLVGCKSAKDLITHPSTITSKRLVITNKSATGKTLEELDFLSRYEVNITRLRRAGVELTTGQNVELHYGDSVLAVGEAENIDRVADIVGNSTKRLDHPEIIPMFLGIVLGVIVGSWPFHLPGVPAPVKLGLAGGPLLVAIILSRIGQIGPITWYMPASANFIVREVGITLFLAAVGLRAGDMFVETLLQGDGFYWMAVASLITLLPLLIIAFIGRIFLKVNYLNLCGLLAGSMTDPPALAFACNATGNDTPTVAYATVYPLTMILRVLCAQLMVLLFMR